MSRYALWALALLGSACVEVLPQAPPDCTGAACECQEHTDCPLETPECLAGVCRASEDLSVAWSHRDAVLPPTATHPDSDLHAVAFNRPIDLAKVASLHEWTDEQAADDWFVSTHPDGYRLAIHRLGLIAVRPTADAPRVWEPEVSELSNQGPGVHPDLRALAGYRHLKATMNELADVKALRSQSPTRLLNTTTHRVVLGAPLHRLIADLVGPLNGRPRGLTIPSLSQLMRRGYAYPHGSTQVSPDYPNRRSETMGRSYRFTLSASAQLRLRSIIPASEVCRAGPPELTATVRINDDEQEVAIDSAPFERRLPAGEYTVSITYPRVFDCGNLRRLFETRWLRLDVDSTGPIKITNWAPLIPLTLDDNPRPVLYNQPAGLLIDSDSDRWPDESDLCPADADEQRDGDQNGVGDVCDGYHTHRIVAGSLQGLDRSGAVIDERAEEGLSSSSFVATLTMPVPETNYPETTDLNLHATSGSVVWQAQAGQPVSWWSSNGQTYEVGSEQLSAVGLDRDAAPALRAISSAGQHAAMHLKIGDVIEGVELNMIITLARTATDTIVTTPYLYAGSEPAFAVTDPSEPLLLIADQNLGSTALTAVRVAPTILARYNGLLLLPPLPRRCSGDSDCPTLNEDGLDIPSRCINGVCRSDRRSGRCLRAGNLALSSFNACTPERDSDRSFCNQVRPCRGNATCSALQCWLRDHDRCLSGETCLPHSLGPNDLDDLSEVLPNDGALWWTAQAAAGLVRPLTETLAEKLTTALAQKSLGVIQALPTQRLVLNQQLTGVGLTACPHEWLDGRTAAEFSLSEQRDVLRKLLSPSVDAPEIFDIAEVNPAWITDLTTQLPQGVCRPLASAWRSTFASELVPQTAELIDIDQDGINELRVGFSVLARSENAEPDVYRCIDFNGDHQPTGCDP